VRGGDLARIVTRYWRDINDARVALAIAYGESGWNERVAGDHIDSFPPNERDAYRGHDCLGYTSWGLFQINIRWNRPLLALLSGTNDACRIAEWLQNPENNVYAAHLIWTNRRAAGLDPWGAWSVYNNGSYRNYMGLANAALVEALGSDVIAAPADFEPEPLDVAKGAPHPDHLAEVGKDTGIFSWYFENLNPEEVIP
jgi:hypothetical protein